MNVDQFLDELRKIKGWRLDGSALRLGAPRRNFCPLTAVANLLHPNFRFEGVGHFPEAGNLLGLPRDVVFSLARCADGPASAVEKICGPVWLPIRRRMLEACGLAKELEA